MSKINKEELPVEVRNLVDMTKKELLLKIANLRQTLKQSAVDNSELCQLRDLKTKCQKLENLCADVKANLRKTKAELEDAKKYIANTVDVEAAYNEAANINKMLKKEVKEKEAEIENKAAYIDTLKSTIDSDGKQLNIQRNTITGLFVLVMLLVIVIAGLIIFL